MSKFNQAVLRKVRYEVEENGTAIITMEQHEGTGQDLAEALRKEGYTVATGYSLRVTA